MSRRNFVGLAAGAAVGWPLAAQAQQASKVGRIGYLAFSTAAGDADRLEALRAGLRALGYVEGKNLLIEFRRAETVDQLQDAAAELVRMNVDVIFALSSTETERARQATDTIPIIFATHADPVGLGHVASLPRPGRNITGLTVVQTEFTEKGMEILKETVPRATRFGVLWSPTTPAYRTFLQAAEAASGKLGVQLVTASVSTVADFDGAFATMAQDRVDTVLVHSTVLTGRQNPRLLAELALKHRLPSMFQVRLNVEAGGLMSYGPDLLDLTRRSAIYIDKILRGTKPVEQATSLQLVINLKTANALGLTIPPAILARADEVIE